MPSSERSLCLGGSGGLPFIVSEVPRQSLIIKEGEYFLFTYENGDITHGNRAGLGLYYRDTRFLTSLETRVEGMQPLFLSSSVERGYMANIHLSNPDIVRDGEAVIPQDTVSIRRSRLIADGLVTVDIPAAAAVDLAGNLSTAAATLSLTYETGAPGVVVSTASGSVVNAPFVVTARWNEPVTGFDASDLVIGNGSASAFTALGGEDRKSTLLNSSHSSISYAVFCLKKKKKKKITKN